MTFNCPSCNAELEADIKPGEIADCPDCGHTFEVKGPTKLGSFNAAQPRTQQPATKPISLPHDWSSGMSGAIIWLFLCLPAGVLAVAFAALAQGAFEAGAFEKAKLYAGACKAAKKAASILFLAWLTIVFIYVFALRLI